MLNIIPLETKGIEVFDAVINNKEKQNQERLSALREFVNGRYLSYFENRRELSAIKISESLGLEKRKDLEGCYSSNVNLDLIKMEIRELQTTGFRAICPYCGINEPNTFDHYLPKGIFPEFAVLPINLLPCCEKCNNKKRSAWLEGDRRTIINYYYDPIPTQKFLHCSLIVSKGKSRGITVLFYLEKPDEIDDDLFFIISSHFKKLELLNRYKTQANDEVSNLFDEITESSFEQTIEMQKRTLQLRVSSYKRKYGANHWKVALYEEVINSDSFFDSCHNT